MGSGVLPPEEIIASEGAPGLGEDLYLVVREDTANKAGWTLIATAQSWKSKCLA